MSSEAVAIQKPDYKIADISLADWGRKEIAIAETEMPGLMALRREYEGQQPLAGVRLVGCWVRKFAGRPATSFLLRIMPRQRLQPRVCQCSHGKANPKKSIGGALSKRSMGRTAGILIWSSTTAVT